MRRVYHLLCIGHLFLLRSRACHRTGRVLVCCGNSYWDRHLIRWTRDAEGPSSPSGTLEGATRTHTPGTLRIRREEIQGDHSRVANAKRQQAELT